MACCLEWVGYGWSCTDWIRENAVCKFQVVWCIAGFQQWKYSLVYSRLEQSWKETLIDTLFSSKQYLLPAIVHINHQPFLERGDGPIVSISK